MYIEICYHAGDVCIHLNIFKRSIIYGYDLSLEFINLEDISLVSLESDEQGNLRQKTISEIILVQDENLCLFWMPEDIK